MHPRIVTTRTVHTSADMAWGPLREIAPDLHIEAKNHDGSDLEEEPLGLRFKDPDGEEHVYVFVESGRKRLVGMLTGGVVLAGNGLPDRALPPVL